MQNARQIGCRDLFWGGAHALSQFGTTAKASSAEPLQSETKLPEPETVGWGKAPDHADSMHLARY